MDINDLAQIIEILRKNDVLDFELEQDGTHIRLSRGPKAQVLASSAHTSATALPRPEIEPAITGSLNGQAIPSVAATSTTPEVPSNFVKVESPIVGTFYRKPSPDADVFVKEGSMVKKGDTLCIIEAMKLMNEIDAPCDGKIEKILLKEAQVVEYGEVLFLINPDA